jgi:hypothetical protein
MGAGSPSRGSFSRVSNHGHYEHKTNKYGKNPIEILHSASKKNRKDNSFGHSGARKGSPESTKWYRPTEKRDVTHRTLPWVME